MRAARKPSAVARELLRNFPKSGGRRRRRKRKGASQDGGSADKNGKATGAKAAPDDELDGEDFDVDDSGNGAGPDDPEADLDEVEASDAGDE